MGFDLHPPPAAARPRARLAESAVRPWLLRLARLVEPLYAKAALRLDGVELRHGERLVEAFRSAQEGRERLVLAFRHPSADEPQLISYLCDVLVAREARRLGRPLPRPAHARFVHGYEVPMWAGPLVRWILPRMGAVPVYHVRFDAASVARIRSLLFEGECPLALAPEGQSSYRCEAIPRIEKGTARLAFWCAEDLEKAGRPGRVTVLPVSVHYRFDEGGLGALEALVASLEDQCRITRRAPAAGDGPGRLAALKERLVALDGALVGLAEGYYGIRRAAAPPPGPAGADRDSRLDRVLEEALARGEAMLGLRPEGDRIARVYRIRQEGWDRIYPTGGLGAMTDLERALADRRAGEAWYAMRHMELVDLAYYLDSAYLEPPAGAPEAWAPSFDRLAETAYNLADLASRLVGGDISHRPKVLRQRAVIVAAPPIDMSARYADYKKDRKAAVDSATDELAAAYDRCIEEYMNDQRA